MMWTMSLMQIKFYYIVTIIKIHLQHLYNHHTNNTNFKRA